MNQRSLDRRVQTSLRAQVSTHDGMFAITRLHAKKKYKKTQREKNFDAHRDAVCHYTGRVGNRVRAPLVEIVSEHRID